jgi:DNA modification methylase
MRDQILIGDALEMLKTLPDNTVNTCVTSPPYFGLRDYGVDGQIGLEQTPEQFIQNLVQVFREVRRTLRDDGTLWVNIGDSYARNGGGVEAKMKTAHKMGVGQKQVYLAGAMQSINKVPKGLKEKDLIGIPWMLAFALRADGWYLRQDIIWHKPNPMPESVKDRCTKAHEYIFLLSKSPKYYFDSDAIKEDAITNDKRRPYGSPGANKLDKRNAQGCGHQRQSDNAGEFRNRRSVWSITTKPFKGAHFATFPEKLVEPCILAGCPEGGLVLDPFFGAGTTGLVAKKLGRDYVGIELNPDYAKIAEDRIKEFTFNILDVL